MSIKRSILKKNSFRVEKFQAELMRNLSILLHDVYNLPELSIAYVVAAPDFRSVKVFISSLISLESEKQKIFDSLHDIFLQKFNEEKWSQIIKQKSFKQFVLDVLQIFSDDISYNLVHSMSCRRAPELFFKFNENSLFMSNAMMENNDS